MSVYITGIVDRFFTYNKASLFSFVSILMICLLKWISIDQEAKPLRSKYEMSSMKYYEIRLL